MHGNITPIKPEPPEPVVKERTITLTNRPPMKINEDEWPIIAQGIACYKVSGAPYEWEIAIRVRRRKADYVSPWHIVHATYFAWDDDVEPDDDSDKSNQRVRVGHHFYVRHDSDDLTKHIVEVGEELKARILNKNMLVYVVFAVDRCFANLPAEGI